MIQPRITSSGTTKRAIWMEEPTATAMLKYETRLWN
jgi:hypothetical protein